MTLRAVLAPGARRELRQALRELAVHNLRAAGELNDAVEAASRLIAANPAIGARRLRLAGKRYHF